MHKGTCSVSLMPLQSESLHPICVLYNNDSTSVITCILVSCVPILSTCYSLFNAPIYWDCLPVILYLLQHFHIFSFFLFSQAKSKLSRHSERNGSIETEIHQSVWPDTPVPPLVLLWWFELPSGFELRGIYAHTHTFVHVIH